MTLHYPDTIVRILSRGRSTQWPESNLIRQNLGNNYLQHQNTKLQPIWKKQWALPIWKHISAGNCNRLHGDSIKTPHSVQPTVPSWSFTKQSLLPTSYCWLWAKLSSGAHPCLHARPSVNPRRYLLVFEYLLGIIVRAWRERVAENMGSACRRLTARPLC